MTTETYEIFAIKYGDFAARQRFESFIAADDHDGPHPIDYFVWVIRNANRTILVDCGFDEAEGAKRGRKIARTPAAALEMVGMSGRHASSSLWSLTCITTTPAHLPSRRRGFTCRLPRWPTLPAPACVTTISAIPSGPTTCARWCGNIYSGRVTFHDGDAEITPGVTVHKVGGHSRGLQCVRVMTANGTRGAGVRQPRTSTRTSRRARCSPSPSTSPMCFDGYNKLKALAASPRHIVPGRVSPGAQALSRRLNSQTQGIVHRPRGSAPLDASHTTAESGI